MTQIFITTLLAVAGGFLTSTVAKKSEKFDLQTILSLLGLTTLISFASYFVAVKLPTKASFLDHIEGTYVALLKDENGAFFEGACGNIFFDGSKLHIDGRSFILQDGKEVEIGNFISIDTDILEDERMVKYTFKGRENGTLFGGPGKEQGRGIIEFREWDQNLKKYMRAEGWFINPVSNTRRNFELIRDKKTLPHQKHTNSQYIKCINNTCKEYDFISPLMGAAPVKEKKRIDAIYREKDNSIKDPPSLPPPKLNKPKNSSDSSKHNTHFDSDKSISMVMAK